jgi:hypothetical protein
VPTLSSYIPMVRVEGEVVTPPVRTMVTRVFYSRIALKIAPFLIGIVYLFTSGLVGRLISLLITLAVIYVVILIFVPQLGGLGSLGTSLGGSLLRAAGALVEGFTGLLDGILGPNKGQVPVLVFDVQAVAPVSGPATPGAAGIDCPNPECGSGNDAEAAHCAVCGTALKLPEPDRPGRVRYAIRVEGQIVGGEPVVGHQVTIDAYAHRGTLMFVSGRDETTGADIVVKRNADIGTQQ